MIGKTCIIIGTRHESIKMSSVVRACERQGADWFMIHTGHHHSYEMDRVFFEEMELTEARYNPDAGSGRLGKSGRGYDGGNRGDFVLCFAGVRINDRSIQLYCGSRNMKALAAIPCHDGCAVSNV